VYGKSLARVFLISSWHLEQKIFEDMDAVAGYEHCCSRRRGYGQLYAQNYHMPNPVAHEACQRPTTEGCQPATCKAMAVFTSTSHNQSQHIQFPPKQPMLHKCYANATQSGRCVYTVLAVLEISNRTSSCFLTVIRQHHHVPSEPDIEALM
jgi:hypothetical protein